MTPRVREASRQSLVYPMVARGHKGELVEDLLGVLNRVKSPCRPFDIKERGPSRIQLESGRWGKVRCAPSL